jgi:RNA 2',3'-cyclic 3'-phosphodiesterase
LVEANRRRLFFAVEVPDRVRDAIDAASEPLRRQQPEARWVDPAMVHLTVAFLGWIDEAQWPAVSRAAAEAAAATGPFELSLTGDAGMFGSRVLWVALAPSDELDQLASTARSTLRDEDLPVETRPFHAHLTIARAGRGARLRRGLVEAYKGPIATWQVERLVLMRSRLRRGGAGYSVQAAWPLGDR